MAEYFIIARIQGYGYLKSFLDLKERRQAGDLILSGNGC